MPTPRSIVFLANHASVAGGEQMLLRMSSVAASAGIDVKVVGPGEPAELAVACERAGLPYVSTRGGRRSTRYAHTRRTLARIRSDLVWANGPFPGLVAYGMKRSWVLHLHQRPSFEQRPVVDRLRRAASLTVVPSQSMKAVLPGSEVLWNWTEAPIGVACRDAARTGFVIGFAGRLSPIKGVDVLAMALQKLTTDGVPDARCLLAGDSRFVPRRLRAQVGAALDPVRARCDLLGWVDPADFLSRVSIVVVPSVWPEPFGLVAAEAMAAGVPLAVSDAGALPEVVGPEHPWIARAGDAADLARVLHEMRNSPDAVSQSVQAARARWEANFSPAAGERRVRELLERLPR